VRAGLTRCALFSVDRYLRRFFLGDERLDSARRQVNAFGNATFVKPSFATKEAAESWVRRVECWREHLRRDLVAGSIPAPAGKGEHWMFVRSSYVHRRRRWYDVLLALP